MAGERPLSESKKPYESPKLRELGVGAPAPKTAKMQDIERVFALAGLRWDPILVVAVREIAAKAFHAADPRPAPAAAGTIALLFAVRSANMNQPKPLTREEFKRLALAVFDLQGGD